MLLRKISQMGPYVVGIDNVVKNNGRLGVKLVGLNKASTFTGFCAEHDHTFFAPIEKGQFTLTPVQAHRMLYRPVARELYNKVALQRSVPILRGGDRGRSIVDQIEMQTTLDGFDLGVDAAVRELTALRRELDSDFHNDDYTRLCAVAIDLDAIPDFMCAGVTQPDHDFHGTQLQDLSQTDPPALQIGFSLLALDKGATAVFVWHGNDNDPSIQLVQSLLSLRTERIPSAILRFAFESFENLYISPNWWDSLTTEQRTGLLARMANGTSFDWDGVSHLEEDGLQLVTWNVTSIREIGPCGLTHA